jgi:4-diphosphocytidyl-2-C-methyl-D-erythritol kinase
VEPAVKRTLRPIRLRAFAKVNLGLEVLALREDGYHELRTIFQTIALHDDIAIRPRRSPGILVRCDHPLVPKDEANLAAKAASALLAYARRDQGLEIAITKRIPVAGGLGGGSSDAAAVLIGLDRALGLGLGRDGLLPVARRLGADVPFFLFGGTALGLGRGDEVYPLRKQVRAQVVLALPECPVSTAAVFRRLDARLTPRDNSNSIYRFVSRDLEGDAYRVLANDLEEAALEEAPELRDVVVRVRGVLMREGARLAALSGSGSSYFGLYDDSRKASRAAAALRKAGVNAVVSRTLTFDQYRAATRT